MFDSDGLFTWGMLTEGCAVMWHGGETCSGWMDEFCSSVVVLLFQLRVIAAVQVTRRKLFCCAYSLQVQEVTQALCWSSEV